MSWQFLKKVLEKERSMCKMFIDYDPGIGKIYFFTNTTGYNETQVAEAEKGLGWHPFVFEGEIYLIPHILPTFKICLEGEKGFKNFFKISSGFAEIYSNDKFEAFGKRLSKEIFEAIPKELKKFNQAYLLADEYISQEEKTLVRGLWKVEEGRIHGLALSVKHDETLYEMNVENHMCPLIRLSPNTLVEIGNDEKDGSEPQKAMKIRIASDVEIHKQALLDMVEESERLNERIKKELMQIK